MWKSTLRIASIIAALATLGLAADKPDFSGTWKIDLLNSDFAGGPAPDSFTRKIEQAEPSLIMTDNQTSALGKDTAVRKYTTDGKETTYQWMGSEVKSAAHWEGNALVVVGKVNAGGTELEVTGSLTLSADGKTLTENDKILAAGNEVGTIKLILIKQTS
jgi:hypothetical protein